MNRMCGRKLILPAKLERLDEVIGFVRETLGEDVCPERLFTAIAVAVEEIFVNISLYAYPGGEGDVTVCCELSEGVARIRFTDCGVAYDPLARKDPDITLPAEERPIGGLGVWIVRRTMDHVEYRRVGGRNVLWMEKALNGFCRGEERASGGPA